MTESFLHLPLAVHGFSDGGKWRLDESFHSYREKKKCVEKLDIYIFGIATTTLTGLSQTFFISEDVALGAHEEREVRSR